MKKKALLIITLTCLVLNTNAQVWNKLGEGIESWNGPTVYCLKKVDSLLYLGGGFFAKGENILKGIAI